MSPARQPSRPHDLVLVARRHRGALATLDTRVAAWAGAQRHVVVIAA